MNDTCIGFIVFAMNHPLAENSLLPHLVWASWSLLFMVTSITFALCRIHIRHLPRNCPEASKSIAQQPELRRTFIALHSDVSRFLAYLEFFRWKMRSDFCASNFYAAKFRPRNTDCTESPAFFAGFLFQIRQILISCCSFICIPPKE